MFLLAVCFCYSSANLEPAFFFFITSSKCGMSSRKDDANTSLTLEAITVLLRDALAMEFKMCASELKTMVNKYLLSNSLPTTSISRSWILRESVRLTTDNIKLKAEDILYCRQKNIRYVFGVYKKSTESGRPTEFFSNFLHELFGVETLPSLMDLTWHTDLSHPRSTVGPRTNVRDQ